MIIITDASNFYQTAIAVTKANMVMVATDITTGTSFKVSSKGNNGQVRLEHIKTNQDQRTGLNGEYSVSRDNNLRSDSNVFSISNMTIEIKQG